jgi:formylglycine-generating enzyme required for sulfatase activity
MARYPITQRIWQSVVGYNPSRIRSFDNPVDTVNWFDVQNFIKALNIIFLRYGFVGQGFFRLPTEAEWEYSAKGGRNQFGFKYAGSDKLNDVGFYRDNSNEHTWPVNAPKQANGLGIYGMSG